MQITPSALPQTLYFPPQTHAAPGALRLLWGEVARFGKTGLLVHGQSFAKSGRLAKLIARVPKGMRVVPHCHCGGEPTLAQLEALRSTAYATRVEWIAAVGGGSVLDLAKACAGLVDAPSPSVIYHDGKALPETGGIPFIAIPSTAGTGSEATAVCVLTNEETGVKKSFRHARLMPQLVLLDPELLEDAPRGVIAASGMDAFTQALESYTSRHATPLTRELSLLATSLIGHALLPTYEGRRSGCTNLLQGSYLAGVALANARLGLVHGLAHPLGTRYGVGHGAACAACLPVVMNYNAEVCGEDYQRVSEVIGEPLLEFVPRLMQAMRLENPFAGPIPADVDQIVVVVMGSGSTAANPRPVSTGDARRVLNALFIGATSV